MGRPSRVFTFAALLFAGCGDDDHHAHPDAPRTPAWAQQAYAKAATAMGGAFGSCVALSADGSTLAVGAREDTNGAGALYVFSRTAGTWSQQSLLRASNAGDYDRFGTSCAISADGSTLAIGAPQEGSAATGIDGNQADDSANDSGAVYVFTRTGTTWAQEAYIKASNTGDHDYFGESVALSSAGATLAVGAYGEASDGSAPANNAAANSGAAYVFARSGSVWTEDAYLKAPNADPGDKFGSSVALSGDGARLAVGAYFEGSAATGVGGDPANNSLATSGAVYVFNHVGAVWPQEAYIKASNPDVFDTFGWTVALSEDGSTLAAGANQEASAAKGIGGDQASNAAMDSGAVYVFSRTGTTWSQQAYVKASNTDAKDIFGSSIALSGDGSTLAISAFGEASAATGVDGDQADNSIFYAGAVYVLARTGTTWSHRSYVKASNTAAHQIGGPEFGGSVALSADASTLAVGARNEDSGAIGIDGNQADHSSPSSGAAYVFAAQ